MSPLTSPTRDDRCNCGWNSEDEIQNHEQAEALGVEPQHERPEERKGERKQRQRRKHNSSPNCGCRGLEVGDHTMPPNVPDQRPRANDAGLATKTQSRGSLHPACSVACYS